MPDKLLELEVMKVSPEEVLVIEAAEEAVEEAEVEVEEVVEEVAVAVPEVEETKKTGFPLPNWEDSSRTARSSL